MSLEVIYFVSQIAAALAILISLVFVILQIRHAVQATRAQTQQAISTGWIAAAGTIADHVDAFNAGIAAREEGLIDLSERDRMQFIVLINAYFRHYENICMQALSGYIDEHIWISWSEHLRTVLSYSGVQAWWRMRETQFAPQFQKFVAAELAKIVPPQA